MNILRKCPKFSFLDCDEGLPRHSITPSTSSVDILQPQSPSVDASTPDKKAECGHKGTRVKSRKGVGLLGIKKEKAPGDQQRVNSSLSELAAAMHSKNDIKKAEIRLRCKSQLPDSKQKTHRLLDFLETVSKPPSTWNEGPCDALETDDAVEDKSLDSFSGINIVDLVDKNWISSARTYF